MSEIVKLEEVLEEYAAATPNGNDLGELRRFSEKYPQYADELADFAAARAVAKHAPEEELEAAEEKRFQSLGLDNLRRVLSEMNSPPESFGSLIDAAKSKGLNRAKFAESLGLSVSLVQYLEKRRLDFATIPQALIAKIARVLEIADSLVAAYLDQSPDYAAQSSFKTNTRAEQKHAKSFAEAVDEDQHLTKEEKKKLTDL